jgi:Cu+-exporting ATPase
LLEKLTDLNSGIISSRVQFGPKEIQIRFDPQVISLRGVVELLAQIGYEPYLALHDIDQKAYRYPERKRWVKIGVAGFCFGNIMMMSFPEYLAGTDAIEPALQTFFSGLSIFLSLPVITYAASEFFISAWNGLKEKYLNIDAPIALALLITFGRSLYEIFTGTGPGYLDTLSGIVFFMLIGRWLQDRTYRTISFDRDYKSFFPIAVEVIRAGNIRAIPVDEVRPDDVFQIHHGELIPMDALLSKGKAEIDYSFVTGESLPVHVEPGEIIYAGGRQTSGRLELVAIKAVSQSYLTHLWNAQGTDQPKIVSHSFIDGLSRYFTYIVLAISVIAAGIWWWQGEPMRMWNAITTTLIVACPCALLLSANFTRGNMMRLLSRHRLYLKNAQVLEEMSRIDTIVFDKTGTLTRKDRMQIRYEGQVLDTMTKRHLSSLLANSHHPLSEAVRNHLQSAEACPVDSFKLTAGHGIEGWVEDRYYKVGSPDFVGLPIHHKESAVAVALDQKPLGVFYVRNAYRMGALALFQALKPNYQLAIVSGDNDGEADTLRQQLGKEGDIRFRQLPGDKKAYIHSLQKDRHRKVMMLGDGLNDAAALQQSDVGIAVSDEDNPFTPAADGILHASVVNRLASLLAYVRGGKKIIILSFGISILYNVIGLYFAVQGMLSPLIAAILMPASSVTIVLLSFGLSGWLGKKYLDQRGNACAKLVAKP